MNQLTIFRILTFILLPVASLFAVMDLMIIPGALSNPALLLIVFILAAFVIYIFASLRFLTKGIDTGRPFNPALRDWIRVNAFVAGAMGLMFFLNAMSVFLVSDIQLRQYLSQFIDTQANVPPMLNIELFVNMMRIAAWFMLFISIFLIVHIIINFRLMKIYHYLFEEPLA